MSTASTDSKLASAHYEDTKDAEKQSSDVDTSIPTLTPAAERRLVWRMDLHVLPLLGLLYAIALIDRTNMAIARTAGMGVELKLGVGDRYSIVSCLFFVPYIIFQLPSNLLLRHFDARNCLTFYVISWGAVQIGMGFVEDWTALIATRMLLGLFEAGFFPALVFIITTWYRRHEVQKRLAFFYLFSIVIGGFSAILAYGINFMSGLQGMLGWRWIFIMEGIVTVVLGVLAFILLPGFPEKNNFLSAEDTAQVLRRIDLDRGDSIPDHITFAKVRHHLSDWTTWCFALMFMSATMPAYAVSYFVTLILASMGYSVRDSFLLTAPPYVVAAVFTFAFAYISDRLKIRSPFIAIQACITITGLAITGWATSNGARYFGLFLVNSGASGCIPAILAWSSNNTVGQSKRSVSTALVVSFGGMGGIFATTAFRQVDAPLYRNGLWASIGCQLLMLTLLSILMITYKRRNKAMRDGKVPALEGTPGFFYTL